MVTSINWVTNPLADPQFFDLALRLGIVLGGSLVLLLVTNITRLSTLWKTTMWNKFVVWLVMAPLMLVVVYAGYAFYLPLLLFLLFQSTLEYIRLVKIPRFHRNLLWINQGILALVISLAPAYFMILPGVHFLLVISAISLKNRLDQAVQRMFATFFGTIWLGFAIALLAHFFHHPKGAHLLVLLIAMVALSDVLAFFMGKLGRILKIGDQPLASNLSPNKVWFGVLGNMIGTTSAFFIFQGVLIFPLVFGIIFSILMGFITAMGDLTESLFKRAAGVKDSGNLIPHHGGILDRFDSLFPSAILVWIFLQFL